MKLEILKKLPKEQKEQKEITPLLFVHGANHGAWCWEENFIPYFSSNGFASYALSFRGHGKSEGRDKLDSFSLTDYVDDVMEVTESLSTKPVLIAHSMGGAVVQKLIHLYPDKIKAAVLIASMRPSGMLKDSLRLILTSFKEAKQLTLFNTGKDVSFPGDMFLSKDLPVSKKYYYSGLMQPESAKARKEFNKAIIPLPIKTEVPFLIIGSKKDRVFSEKAAIAIGKSYYTKPVIFPNLSHDMMLDPNWEIVAEQILSFLNKVASL